MLTLFTMPKTFKGHIDVIQRNAIRSWLALRPACEIILLGNDEGTAEVAHEFGLRHVSEISCNEYGTPLVSDVFEQAERAASHDLLCYVNADIILLSDFLPAVERVARHKRRFLVVGQRWDLDVFEPLDFSVADCESHLRQLVADRAVLHPPSGIDYFAFSGGLWEHIPPFAIGRTAWDNWLIYSARVRRAAVIDATPGIMAIHQNHDYRHVSGGFEGAWNGPEAIRNREVAGDSRKWFTLLDANWLLTSRGLRRARSPEHLQRALRTLPLLHPRLHTVLHRHRWCIPLVSRAAAALLRQDNRTCSQHRGH